MGLDNLIYLLVILLSVGGFAIASYIFFKKKDNKPMVCPLNFKCEEVLYSKYSKFLGVPTELLGMVYYIVSIAGYGTMMIWLQFRTPQFISFLFLTSGVGFIFSLYLTSIQLFRIKEMCSWCLGSALISILTFILILKTNWIVAMSLAVREYTVTGAFIYSGVLLLGLVMALIYEFLSVYFMKDGYVSEVESHTLHLLSQITLLVLGGVAVFNYVFYVANPVDLASSPGFIAKVIVLAILILVYFVYNIYPSRGAYLGPLSVISWGYILFLETQGADNTSVLQYLVIYLVLSVAAVTLMPKIRA